MGKTILRNEITAEALKWDSRYKSTEYVYGTEPNEFIKEITTKLKKEKLLAVAEGEGRNAVYLASLGFKVSAWDISEEGLKKCQALAAEKKVKVTTEKIDLTAVEWPHEKWDSIIGVFTHFYPQDRQNIFIGIRDALRSGGTAAFELYSKEQLQYGTGGPKTADLLYSPQEILQFFRSFRIRHFFYGETERTEGKLHNGTGHVIQILAEKK